MAEPSEIVGMAELILNLGRGTTLSDADAALLEQSKRQVEDRVRRFLRFCVTQTTKTVFLPSVTNRDAYANRAYMDTTGDTAYWTYDTYGSTGDILQLPDSYVSSITNIWEDVNARAGQGSNDFAAATLLTSGTDYWLDMDDANFSKSGHVIKETGSWSTRQRTIKVTYVAGFTATQLDEQYRDIKQAVILETRKWFKRAKSGQSAGNNGVGEIKSESIGGEYKVEYTTTEGERMGSLSNDTVDLIKPYRRWSMV